MWRFITPLILSLLGFRVDAAMPSRYLAPMEESSWELTDQSAILCRMEHVIPRFGKVVFSREAGRPLRMDILSLHAFALGTNVELRSEATAWSGQGSAALLARFEVTGRQPMFRIPDDVAERTYQELHRGFQPGFLFYTDRPLIATASTVRFGPAEEAFDRCSAALYRENFEDVRVNSIHFEPDNEFPDIVEEQQAFRRLFDYLAVDDGISEIVVTGHADKTGLACYNEGLSERRAWYVYDLLVAQGVDPALLRVNYFGEYRPAQKGNVERAHAANRRVTVELRR